MQLREVEVVCERVRVRVFDDEHGQLLLALANVISEFDLIMGQLLDRDLGELSCRVWVWDVTENRFEFGQISQGNSGCRVLGKADRGPLVDPKHSLELVSGVVVEDCSHLLFLSRSRLLKAGPLSVVRGNAASFVRSSGGLLLRFSLGTGGASI